MEKRVDIIVGGTDAGATVTFARVGAEAKKLAGIERSLADARREYLTNEAAAGNETAQFELKKLGIARDYAAQRERISAIMGAESASEQQKIAAGQILLTLAQQEAEALERVRLEREAMLAGPGTPAGQQDAHLAAFAEERQFREWVVQQRKQEADLERGIAAAREASLRNEVAAGSEAAAVELERLAVAKAFGAQRDVIVQLLKQEAITEAQRIKLEELLVKLAQQEADAVERVAAARGRATRSAAADRGGLAGLKSAFGEESEAGLVLKAVRGAGAIAVVGLGLQMLERGSAKAAELSKALRDGSKSTSEIAEEAIRSVPLLGNLYGAARNFAEVVTGVDADLDSVRRQAELVGKAIDAWRANLRQNTRDHEELLDTIRQIRHEADLLALPPGQREGAAAAFAAGERARGIAKSVKDKIDAAEQRNAEKVKPLQDEFDSIVVPEYATRGDGGYGTDDNSAEIAAAERKRAELQGLIDKFNKQLHDSTKTLRRDLADALSANISAAALGFAERFRNGLNEALDEVREGAQKLADARAQGRAEELRSLGRDLDAELLLIRGNLDKELAEIERQRQERARLSGRDPKADVGADLEAKAARQRADNAELAATRAEGERATQRQLEEKDRAKASEQRKRDADDFLRQQRLASAEEAAAAGRMSKAELERLHIAEQYLERRKQITDVMAQEGLTLEQRAALMRQLQGLDAEEASAKSRAGAGRSGPLFVGGVDTRAGGTGFATRDEISRQFNEPPEVKATKEQTKQFFDFLKGPFATAIKDIAEAAAAAALAGVGVAPSSGNVPHPPS